jgi:hypothetical protein
MKASALEHLVGFFKMQKIRYIRLCTGVFLIAIVCLLLSACDKDDPYVPDPVLIEPGPYFPVYPGSFWDYTVAKYMYSGGTIIGKSYSTHRDTTASEYKEHHYATWAEYPNGWCNGPLIDDDIRFSELCLVPFFNGCPVYYYDQILLRSTCSHGGHDSFDRYPMLSEEIGKSFRAEGWLDPRVPNYPLVLTALLKTTNNNGDSILICEEKYSQPYSHVTRKWYTKGVGLTMSILLTYTGDTLELKTLDTCFVNKPY